MPSEASLDPLFHIRVPGRRLVPMNLKLPADALDQLKQHSAAMGGHPSALARFLVLDGLKRLAAEAAPG